MNQLKVNKIKKEKNRIDIFYEIEGEWEKFFNIEENFFIEYDRNIEDVPDSICIIPFLSNILPISWVNDAKVYLKELDKNFYNSIKNIKQGYINMHPNINFLGDLIIENVIENKNLASGGVLVFFSGGADSFSTLISHINENPQLLTVWGSDIMLDDIEGWNNVKEQINDVSLKFGVKKNIIKTNFRTFIRDNILDMLVKEKAGDGWWHGFQHGIGLIGQAAPIVFDDNITKIYIASSYCEKNKANSCASDPTIDNHFKVADCTVYHDQYELGRLEKIKKIIEYSNANKITPLIRVCWESRGGNNCCKCEKCYRTIYEILACGDNPNKYGFIFNDKINKKIKNYIMYKKILSQVEIAFWKEIKDAFLTRKSLIINNKEYKWIYKLDLEKGNNMAIKKFRIFLRKLKGKLKRNLKKLKKVRK